MATNNPRPKLDIGKFFLLGGIFFIVADIFFLFTGEINLKMEHEIDHKLVSMTKSPVEYWVIVTIIGMLGVALIWLFFKQRALQKLER